MEEYDRLEIKIYQKPGMDLLNRPRLSKFEMDELFAEY